MEKRDLKWVGDYEFKTFLCVYMETSDLERMEREGYLQVKSEAWYTKQNNIFVYARPKL